MNNSKARIRTDKAGEIATGTMIIFIALLITTSATSTIIIATAYRMEQQAQHSGDVAIVDVSTGFKIINIAGDRVNPNGAWKGNTRYFEMILVKIALKAGCGDVNITDLIIEMTDGEMDMTLSYIDTGPGESYFTKASANHFTVEPMRDMAPTNISTEYAMMTPGDVALIIINGNQSGLRLMTQTPCHMKFIPKFGIPTLESFITPSVYGPRLVTPLR